MKKIIIAISFIVIFSTDMHGQMIDRIPESRIKAHFISSWLYFRMRQNPLLSYEETRYRGGEWRRPWEMFMPPEFTIWHSPDIKILPWYDESLNPRLGFISFGDNTDGLYIIEKGSGITGVKWEYFVDGVMTGNKFPVDTVHVNVYDSIFPFDNRFLAYVTPSGEIGFYSGNISWGSWRNLNMDIDLLGVSYIRGVQFGLQRLRRLPDGWITNIRENLPEYSDWDFVFAAKSFLTGGRLLITAPPEQAHEHLEFLFYSDHPEKTGDEEGVFYEFKYIYPTATRSISERRLEKRKLSPEELENIWDTSLRHFFDFWRPFEEPEIVIEDE